MKVYVKSVLNKQDKITYLHIFIGRSEGKMIVVDESLIRIGTPGIFFREYSSPLNLLLVEYNEIQKELIEMILDGRLEPQVVVNA